MKDEKPEIEELLEKLRQTRDELNLQLHLGKAEARDLWEQTEERWNHLRGELDKVSHDSDALSKDVGATAMLVAEEIRDGYERLKALL